MLQGREVFFFESFFRLIFEFLTNSVLQCVVKKGGPLNLWVNALVLKDERVPEFLTYRSIGSSSLPPLPKGAKNQKHGEYVSIWGEGPQCLWVWPDTGVAPLYLGQG